MGKTEIQHQDAVEKANAVAERVAAAFLEELSWIKDEKQRSAWFKEYVCIYELGRAAATNR